MFGMFKRKTPRSASKCDRADAFTYKSGGAPWPGMQTVAFVPRKKMFKFVVSSSCLTAWLPGCLNMPSLIWTSLTRLQLSAASVRVRPAGLQLGSACG